MPDPDHTNPPIRPLQREDGSWFAEIAWHRQISSHIGDFKTESEVQDWIQHKSAEYLRELGL